MSSWEALLSHPLDLVGGILFALAFPLYHGLYPSLVRRFPNRAARRRFDLFRRSWIAGLVENRDLLVAAQQTRNLAMVNSLLASSALILMGLTANVLVQVAKPPATSTASPTDWGLQLVGLEPKLFLLIVVFAVAFGYVMGSLRHLGHFNLVIGADPELIEEQEGVSAVDYFSALINRASNRHTLGVRTFYSAFPLFAWLFDSRLFVLLTLASAIRFVGFQDFRHLLRRS
ncbi:MAG: DUF599 domain-containing protein [Acidobacteriota bacterium]